MCTQFTEADVGKRVENANGEEIGIVTAFEGPDLAYVEPDPNLADSIRAALGWETDQDDAAVLEATSVREITDDVVRLESGSSDPNRDAFTDADTMGGDDGVIEPEDLEAREREQEQEQERTGDRDPADEMAGADEIDGTEEIGGADELHPTREMEGADAIDSDGEPGSVDEPDRGMTVDPSDVVDRGTELEVDPDEDMRSSDAETDADESVRRTDAAVDLDDDARNTDAEVDPSGVRDAESDSGGPVTEDATRTQLEEGSDAVRGADRENESESESESESGSESETENATEDGR